MWYLLHKQQRKDIIVMSNQQEQEGVGVRGSGNCRRKTDDPFVSTESDCDTDGAIVALIAQLAGHGCTNVDGDGIL